MQIKFDVEYGSLKSPQALNSYLLSRLLGPLGSKDYIIFVVNVICHF